MTAATQKETHGFQTEVQQLLHLMIHSLYSNKEIFLRELISNASDAADKLRFLALSEPSLLSTDPELKIWVDFDKDARTITIRDNGVGMTREEVMQNLGTIAKSGTKEFLHSLTGDQAKDAKLIGQFGVGFYSAFIVADQVVVTTRKAGLKAEEAIKWVSAGTGTYELESITKESRGTEVVLHLKPDEEEFLNPWRLREIIKKYSDHIGLPIVMKADEDEGSEGKGGEEVVNRATALWTLPKQDITDEQYIELYKHIAHDFENPLIWSHNKVEGKQEYTSVLYIPTRAPFDLWHQGRPRGLKLYVKRVFIMDDAEQFLPNYLRFVRGIIDSNDLPLNVSREILQNNRLIESMKSAVTKRILGILEQLAKDTPEKYQTFWKEFGPVLKEGPAEDFANREQIAKLLRFASTKSNTDNQEVSLEEYLARAPAGQDKIYYITGENFKAVQNSPHLEIFKQKGIEVLLLSDRIDEWLVSHLTEFMGKPLQSVTKGDLNLGAVDGKQETEVEKEVVSEYEATLNRIKDILKDNIKDVRLTKRLTSSPACLVVDEKDMSLQMERLLKAAGHQLPMSTKPILELNPEHPMIKQLKSEKTYFEDWVHILLDQAVLAEGGQLQDPASFVKRFNHLLVELTQHAVVEIAD